MNISQLNGSSENVMVNFDPRTKLALLLITNTIIISDNTNIIVYYLKYLFVIAALLLLLNMGKLKMSIIYIISYGLAVTADRLLGLGIISGMSLLGVVLRIVAYLVERMLPSMMLAWFVLHSTKVSEFVLAMEKLHLPRAITIPFAIVFRFFPTLKEEYSSIQDAMKMREISLKNGLFSTIEYRMVPLLVSVTKIGDELSAAAMTRGLTTDRTRSSYQEIGFYLQDYFLNIGLLISLALFVMGIIRG